MDDSEAIRHLQQDDRYRVIERLIAPGSYNSGEPATARLGIVLDTETTGIDTANDKIIELGFVAFEYDAATGAIHRIVHSYDGFEDPGAPLDPVVVKLTGITDEMVAGKKLDEAEINDWLAKADLIVAHNAAFDRQMLERRLPVAAGKNWACTLNEIDWAAEGIASRKLDYIAYRLGYFFDGHRAVNDAEATLHLLTRALPESGRLAMSMLLEQAREKSRRFFAIDAAFEKKDALKARGYQWLPEFGYEDRFGKFKKGVWSRAVPDADADAEAAWLESDIYGGRSGRFAAIELTAANRYSTREFRPD